MLRFLSVNVQMKKSGVCALSRCSIFGLRPKYLMWERVWYRNLLITEIGTRAKTKGANAIQSEQGWYYVQGTNDIRS